MKRRCLGSIGAFAVLIACVLASALAVVARAAPNHSQPRPYSITDLGTLGGSGSFASAINDRGKIVGDSSLSGDAAFHAFLYDRGRMTDLLPGTANSEATDINDRGKIVGMLGGRAFVYRRGQVTQISLGGPSSSASGINDRGDVVGTSELPGTPAVAHAFLYRHGRTIDLTPTLPSGHFSLATAINDRGDVVGWSTPPNVLPRPFLWRKGTLTDLPLILPGDDVAIPGRINSSRKVVGASFSLTPFEEHAVLLSRGRLISLGRGQAISLNSRGQVVGFGPDGAFLYEKGTRIQLNSLLPAGSGWTQLFPSDINDRGQIVGGGFHNGAFRAFLLSPSKNDDDDD